VPARVRYGIRASASSGAGGTQCMGCMYVGRGASLLPAEDGGVREREHQHARMYASAAQVYGSVEDDSC